MTAHPETERVVLMTHGRIVAVAAAPHLVDEWLDDPANTVHFPDAPPGHNCSWDCVAHPQLCERKPTLNDR